MIYDLTKNHNIYHEFNDIIYNTNSLKKIKSYFSKKFIPQIQYDKKQIKHLLINRIKRDKIRFKIATETWSLYDHLEIQQYILEKEDFVLNEKSLNEIDALLNHRHNIEKVRMKIQNYGFQFRFD